MDKVYLYALGANLSFAIGVQFFTHYAKNLSSVWVNCLKAVVGASLFLLTVLLGGGFSHIEPLYLLLFAASGMLGLGAADVFLIKSFSLMGPGRTMMLFGFQPLVIGALSLALFGQTVNARQLVSIAFFVVCLFIISLESFKKHGHWNLRAGAFAMCAILLDSAGVVITRYSFDHNPGLATIEGNFYRAAGAVLFFAVLSRFRPVHFLQRWRSLDSRHMFLAGLGAFMGTYLSLMLYLNAVRYAGALAALSGIGITGTIFASLFESLREKKAPSPYLLLSFVFFFAGMRFLLF